MSSGSTLGKILINFLHLLKFNAIVLISWLENISLETNKRFGQKGSEFQNMLKFKLIWFVLLVLLQMAKLSSAREIDHAVIHEKIDRVGSIQSGGEGKN